MTHIIRTGRLSLIALAAFASTASLAAGVQSKLEGYWEPPGGGSMKMLEAPVLTDKGKAALQVARTNIDMKDGVSVGSRYCLPLVQPWNLFQSAPISIVGDERETTMMFEQHSTPSHIYTDGRAHPTGDRLILQTNGHSIGKWDGDTFVVDTVGFADVKGGPASVLPGNVPKTANTHLVARFTPSADGSMLKGHFTVDDAGIVEKPYSWEFTWKRSDAGAYAAVGHCDPRDLANSTH